MLPHKSIASKSINCLHPSCMNVCMWMFLNKKTQHFLAWWQKRILVRSQKCCPVPSSTSFFQISALIIPWSPSHQTGCLSLSTCLHHLLFKPLVCFPSTCLSLLLPIRQNQRSRRRAAKGGGAKSGGLRTQSAGVKTLPLLLHRSSPPAHSPIDGVLKGGAALIAEWMRLPQRMVD